MKHISSIRWWIALALLSSGSLSLGSHEQGYASGRKTRSILFVVQSRARAFVYELDRPYLNRLIRKHGFRISIAQARRLSLSKLRGYQAVVLFKEPGCSARGRGRRGKRFASMLQRYVAQGGGLFLMPWQSDCRVPMPRLARSLQFQLSSQVIIESDRRKRSHLVRGSIPTPIAFTTNIASTPVSRGVKQLWYMYGSNRRSRQTGILKLSSSQWKVVARASNTAFAATLRTSSSGRRRRARTPLKAPPFFAIRRYKKGRVALLFTWYHGIFGQGSKWVFNGQILERGSKGKASHFHRLVVNTLNWLAGAGRTQVSVGLRGANLFVPAYRNIRRFQPFAEKRWTRSALERLRRRRPIGRPYRGVIGLRSRYGGGRSTLAQYKQMALRHKIDFLVFLEDYNRLNPRNWAKLKLEARRLSDRRVLLIPGYRLPVNIGHKAFAYGQKLPWLPRRFVRKGTLMLQPQNPRGRYIYDKGLFYWVLHKIHGSSNMFGFYHFRNAGPMKPEDLRLYSGLGVVYTQGTRKIERIEDAYIRSTTTGSPPTPLSITEIDSAAQIPQLLRARIPLTHIVVPSLGDIPKRGQLGWNGTNSIPRVYISNGPHILRFVDSFMYQTYGALSHVTGRALQPVTLDIRSPRPLRQILLFDNARLYRTFYPKRGQKRWKKTLLLPGNLQKNLVLKVYDDRRGSALSFPNRSIKIAHGDIYFCNDHINDCRRFALMARGTFQSPIHFPPRLPLGVAGAGWDGGPVGNLDLMGVNTNSFVYTHRGTLSLHKHHQTPVFHHSDEGSVGVQNTIDEVFPRSLRRLPLSPWFGYGPKRKSRQIQLHTQLRLFKPIAEQDPRDDRLYFGGSDMSMGFWYRWRYRFLQPTTLKGLELFSARARPKVPVYFASSRQSTIHLQGLGSRPRNVMIQPGDWFAFWSSNTDANTHLFFNLGRQRFQLQLRYGFSRIRLSMPRARRIRRGQELQMTFASVAFGVKTKIDSLSTVKRYARYLRSIQARVSQGRVVARKGVLHLAARHGVTAFSVPRASSLSNLGLPIRVSGLQQLWSAALLQKSGYVPSPLRSSRVYGKSSRNRYRPLGVDKSGSAWFPLHVSRASHSMEAGHPVVAMQNGRLARSLAIQVTALRDDPYRWYVAVNHLAHVNRSLTVKLRLKMSLPNFPFRCRQITLKPHQHLVVSWYNRLHASARRCR